MPDRASIVKLTTDGLLVELSNGTVLWSTPPLKAPVSALHLLETGNLVLLDATNNSLWESFDYPSDTLVSGQQIPTGSYLSSSVSSESDLRQGNYRLDITSADALLNWSNNTYWRLSNDINSVKDRDVPVTYMTTNDSGLYLIESKGNAVFQLKLSTAPFRIVQLGADGRLKITSYPTINSTSPLDHVFMAPSSSCDLPLECGSLGLCSLNLNSSSCICPSHFVSSAQSRGCMPGSDIPLATNTSCDGSKISYMNPTDSGRNISSCRDLCTSNCSCSGYLFDNSSLSCFLFQHPIGSLTNANTSEATNSMVYVKTQGSNSHGKSSSEKKLVAVLAPSIAAIFLVIVGLASIMWRYNKQKKRMGEMQLAMANDKLHGAPKRQ
ncbi:G-type lectin S-receptor-like serine/threonine-protein kinase [Carex littledalei]|uniref:non-specific serine/threonine protein kinase n=1 Tax=Carex littledalei TaxID=544730 RepID=A0A833QEH7_9POAL|nr:G-type lectin S-receptor-like serine/threonine-protein kinase [Carex littledalei]